MTRNYVRSAISLQSDLAYIQGFLGAVGLPPLDQPTTDFLREKISKMMADEKEAQAKERDNE